MYPGDAGDLGADFAGVVVRVGETPGEGSQTVNNPLFQVGDLVFGVSLVGSLRIYTVAREEHIKKIPSGMSFEKAASLPTLITTVHHGLVECGKLSQGQRVLVHAGTGGVGLVAIHWAKRLGCEVVATAGSNEKWEVLRKLGVRYIGSSRDAEAFCQSMEEVGEVDVVLNSLSGKFIEYSLQMLKKGGRFIEIGKRNIWSAEQVAAVRNDVDYHVIALDVMTINEPIRYRQLFEDAMAFGVDQSIEEERQSEKFISLQLPLTCFPIDKIQSAFRYMQKGEHIGKIIITQKDLFNNEDTYLISGGLGYLGRLVIRAMGEHGAKNNKNIVVLSSTRSNLPDDWDLEVNPTVVKCDVGNLEEVQRVFDMYGNNIRGIIHSAGVVSDRTLANLMTEDFERVYRPKVEGGRNLDACARTRNGVDVDFFVVFSSISASLGAQGQANYVSANGFLDQLVEQRVRDGLSGLSVRFGGVLGGGMAQKLESTLRSLGRFGILPVSPDDAIGTMCKLMAQRQTAAVFSVYPIDQKEAP